MKFSFDPRRLKSQLIPFTGCLGVACALNGVIAFKFVGYATIAYSLIGPFAHPMFRGHLLINIREFLIIFILVLAPIAFTIYAFTRSGERRPFFAGIIWGLAGGFTSGIIAVAARAMRGGVG